MYTAGATRNPHSAQPDLNKEPMGTGNTRENNQKAKKER